jgi:GDP-D-mannose 3',5'-epimerase
LAVEVLVTGAGGFLGGHVVKRLLSLGHSVIGVDIKPLDEWWQCSDVHNVVVDLRNPDWHQRLIRKPEVIYHLAADMGGIEYITRNDWSCASSVAMTVNVLQAAITLGTRKLVYTSSACVYPPALQSSKPIPLVEAQAYPANPEQGYGWEKLFSERLCSYASATSDLNTEVARLFNVYGPHGTWSGGREKAPASICRQVAEVSRGTTTSVELRGTGTQQRSFLYVDDCVTGLLMLADANCNEPLNIASTELVRITQLARITASVAGVKIDLYFDPEKPIGVKARIPDITRAHHGLNWYPKVPLAEGINVTYQWIREQLEAQHQIRPSV